MTDVCLPGLQDVDFDKVARRTPGEFEPPASQQQMLLMLAVRQALRSHLQ